MAEQLTGVIPDRFVELVGADLLVFADPLAAEPIRIGANTTIVRVGNPSFGALATDYFSVVRIATTLALDQALQQMPSTSFSLPALLSVFA